MTRFLISAVESVNKFAYFESVNCINYLIIMEDIDNYFRPGEVA